jgi:peroxiredoxin (alkyl hydroperoxide reductase subunit C)
LAISVDSPFSHLHYLLLKHSQGGLGKLNYPFISNLNQKYRLLTSDRFACPVVFILDKEGIIQYYNVNKLLCGRSIKKLLRTLKSIQYLKQNPGQACTIDWKTRNNSLYYHPSKSKVYFQTLYSQKKTYAKIKN